MTTPTTDSPWLTHAEAAAYLRVHPRTISRWADAGRLTKRQIDGLRSVRFARAELDALVVPADDVEAGEEPTA